MSKEYNICKDKFDKKINLIKVQINKQINEIQEEIKQEEDNQLLKTEIEKRTNVSREMDS
jgi:fructose-specific phosphotransferase system component IIB